MKKRRNIVKPLHYVTSLDFPLHEDAYLGLLPLPNSVSTCRPHPPRPVCFGDTLSEKSVYASHTLCGGENVLENGALLSASELRLHLQHHRQGLEGRTPLESAGGGGTRRL